MEYLFYFRKLRIRYSDSLFYSYCIQELQCWCEQYFSKYLSLSEKFAHLNFSSSKETITPTYDALTITLTRYISVGESKLSFWHKIQLTTNTQSSIKFSRVPSRKKNKNKIKRNWSTQSTLHSSDNVDVYKMWCVFRPASWCVSVCFFRTEFDFICTVIKAEMLFSLSLSLPRTLSLSLTDINSRAGRW